MPELRWVIVGTLQGACQSIPLDEEGQRLATQSLMAESYRKTPSVEHEEWVTRMMQEEFCA